MRSTIDTTDAYDVSDYGALDSAGDIGPAVQAALNAAITSGGGTVLIPPRADALAWGWSTPVTAAALDKMSLAVVGIVGQTAIEIPIGVGAVVCQIGNSNALLEFSDLIFIGDPAAGTNATCVLNIQQARMGVIRRCQFWGLRCSLTSYGVAHVLADTVHVEDCIFSGCDYTGTAAEGGCLVVTGQRDACRIVGCRFDVHDGGGWNGLSAEKGNAATNAHLWISAQGLDGATTAYGEVLVESCYFGANALDGVMFAPLGSNVLDHARVQGCTFNAPSTLNGAPIHTKVGVNQLVVDGCMFGNSNATSYAVAFRGRRLIVRNSHAATGGKKIIFTGATHFVQVEESTWANGADVFTFDTSIATPTKGITIIDGVQQTVFP